jgi:hypothetical protein
MEQPADRRPLNTVLLEAARLTADERRARITHCVAEGRHNRDTLPFCTAPSGQGLVRYCDRCWSVIDPHGLTWSWTPQQPESADARA